MSTKLHYIREKVEDGMWKFPTNQLKKWQQKFTRKYVGDRNLRNIMTNYWEMTQICLMENLPGKVDALDRKEIKTVVKTS